MRSVFLAALLLACVVDADRGSGRFDRFNSRCVGGRSDRGLPCEDLAFVEFAPATGAGMGTACACATITGAKGETVTVSRTGNATCSPLGMATTGISSASLVECAGNLGRVELSSSVLGLRVEEARTNVLVRFIDFANAAWADVSTPVLTGSQASPFTGTFANLAVQFDDNDGVSQEGRSQAVTVTATQPYVLSCYVRAGTLSSATVSLDGTTASISGLSATTWSIVTVADASASGVAITAQALNGAVASDTGTVIWGGCQVEQGLFRTSVVPTTATTVTRNAESPSMSATWTSGVYSAASTVETQRTSSANERALTARWGASVFDDSYFPGVRQTFFFDGAAKTTNAALGLAAIVRVGSYYDGVNLGAVRDGITTTTAQTITITGSPVTLRLGVDASSGVSGHLNGIITKVCFDPTPTRCR